MPVGVTKVRLKVFPDSKLGDDSGRFLGWVGMFLGGDVSCELLMSLGSCVGEFADLSNIRTAPRCGGEASTLMSVSAPAALSLGSGLGAPLFGCLCLLSGVAIPQESSPDDVLGELQCLVVVVVLSS